MGQNIIPVSLPQPIIIGLLKIKKVIIIFNSINIITYKIKWLNRHTTKCWAQLSMNCCALFWRSWLRTCISTNSSIGLGSRPRDVAYNEKRFIIDSAAKARRLCAVKERWKRRHRLTTQVV
jgi:hypothetical protein